MLRKILFILTITSIPLNAAKIIALAGYSDKKTWFCKLLKKGNVELYKSMASPNEGVTKISGKIVPNSEKDDPKVNKYCDLAHGNKYFIQVLKTEIISFEEYKKQVKKN